MDKYEANRKMKYAFSDLNGSNSGNPGYHGEKNWQSRTMQARSTYGLLKRNGYWWQANRIMNYHHRLHKQYHKK